MGFYVAPHCSGSILKHAPGRRMENKLVKPLEGDEAPRWLSLLSEHRCPKGIFFFFFFFSQITAIEKYGDAVDLYICIIHYAIVRLIFHLRFIFNAAKL